MVPEQMNSDRFDRIIGDLSGLPDVKMTRPSTQIDSLPLVGTTVTYVVQTARLEKGYAIFVQVVDADGRTRFVIPPKVAAAIYRQRQALADRSTPASRARKTASKARAKAKADKAKRKAAWAAAHPDKAGKNPFAK